MTTKTKVVRVLSVGFLVLLTALPAQSQQLIVGQGYAHNDYLHERPLLDALESGYINVEADIFLQHGQLILAHWFPMFKENRTLKHFYLDPLLKYVIDRDAGSLNYHPPITLHIDIKSSPKETYLALRLLLEKYKRILSSWDNGVFRQSRVNIVITGRKPEALIRAEKCRLVMMDECSNSPLASNSGDLYAMSSCRYSRISSWRGDGPMPDKDKFKLRQFAMQAHKQGKKARLWASPENDEVRRSLLACGFDYITTDRLAELKKFFLSQR